MKIIGLTGGIGSGKTLIASLFQYLGASVYDSDHHAKEIMADDPVLIDQIKEAFGQDVYDNAGKLQRDLLRDLVFKNPDRLNQLNKIVHSSVRSDFREWTTKQTTELIIFESALILNKNWIDLFDYMVFVQADEPIRISRIMDRDQLDEAMIKRIMENQVFDKSLLKNDKLRTIDNSGKRLIIPRVWKLYREFTVD